MRGKLGEGASGGQRQIRASYVALTASNDNSV
jgi:hypothetical protein